MITANSGPLVIYGQASFADYNSQIGPSSFVVGAMLPDTRKNYDLGNAVTTPMYGWYSTGDIPVINYAPSAISAVNIAAAQTPTAGTPLTLVAATGAGITVGASSTNIVTGVVTTGLLAIDGVPGFLPFGTDSTIQCYDPTKAVARAVRITSAGNDSTATFTVSGFDVYGQPMTSTVTGANAGVATTLKAFKFVKSVTPAGTLSGSNVSVGTADVYGFPLRADSFYQVGIVWAGSWITANAGFVAAVATSPATATTGDVRGTYATQSASNGTNVLQITVTPNPNVLSGNSTGGLAGIALATTGVTQV